MEYQKHMRHVDNVKIVYQRYTGSYEGFAEVYPQMRHAIFEHVQKGNLWNLDATLIFTGYNDNPGFTDDGHLRTSVGMSINEGAYDFEAHGLTVGTLDGNYVVFEFHDTFDVIGKAWDLCYKEILEDPRLTLREAFPFEVYVSDPRDNPLGKQRFDIYIPIV